MAFPERPDVVIVGGGAAGCTLARRLAGARDRSVLLIEAGGGASLMIPAPSETPTVCCQTAGSMIPIPYGDWAWGTYCSWRRTPSGADTPDGPDVSMALGPA